MTTRAPDLTPPTTPDDTPPPLAGICHVLPCEPRSAHRARALVTAQLAAWGMDHHAEDAVLLASELVTNACIHTGNRTCHLVLACGGTALRISVVDASRTLPCLITTGPNDDNGRGLHVVQDLAARWGATYTATGKTVWCELRLRRA
jgi:anti-sigma regulatory factor (Ser/Thr protein kinase)